MIQYYSVKTNIPQMSLVHDRTSEETILKQLKYVTKGYKQHCFKFKMTLFFSSF